MMKTLLTILFFAGTAQAGVPYWQPPQASTRTAYGTGYLAGVLDIYASTSTAAAAPSIMLDGVNRQLTVRNGAAVSTMSSTGFYGNGSGLTNAANAAYAAALSTAVYTTGTQSIGGQKTFTSPVQAQTATDPGPRFIAQHASLPSTYFTEIWDSGKIVQARNSWSAGVTGVWISSSATETWTDTTSGGFDFQPRGVSALKILGDKTVQVPGGAFAVGVASLAVVAGKVGVGTASPATDLNVSYSTNVTSGWINRGITVTNGAATAGNTAGILFGTSLVTNPKQYIGGVRTAAGSGVGDLIFALSSVADANPVMFSEEKMRILANGNVGIRTSAPESRLDVVSDNMNLPSASGAASDSLMRIGYLKSWAGAQLDFGLQNGGAYPMWLQARNPTDFSVNRPLLLNPNGGNVGIGTTVPGATLHLKKIDNGSEDIFQAWANNGTLGVGINYAGIRQIGPGNNGLSINASGTEKVNIGATSTGGVSLAVGGGNVGVGDATPQAKLTVNGNTHSSGTVSGVAFIGSGAGLSEVSNLVSSGTVSVATGTISITGLDGNADGPYRLVFFSSTTNSGASFSLYFNSDVTATNYYTQRLFVGDTAVSGSRANSSVFIWTASGSPNQLSADITVYRGFNGHILYSSRGTRAYASDGSDTESLDAKGHHASAQTNITSMSISGPNGVMLVGTTWELYRSR